MLIDEAYIVVRAGKGGDGKVSFFPGAKTGPDGGRGGEGGSVYARVNRTISSLNHYVKQKLFVAEDGKVGQSFQKTGADGDDLILDVPVGTTFINLETQEEVELMNEGELVPLCRGGWGGKGNMQLTNARFTAPRRAEKGKPGQEKKFKVLLKLIADFGLIGLPNAGKSSLLNELTAANVKTAAYAFTTLEPNLGAFYNRVIADIPGLIEGASSGKGLGTKFLKHIEKVQMLLHCVAADSADMMRDYKTVREELHKHNPALVEKKEIILLTKYDAVTPEELEEKKKTLQQLGKSILTLSIYDADSIENLRKQLLV